MAFDPMSMIAGGIGGGINIVQGNNQIRQGEEIARNNDRPLYDIPEEIDMSLNNIRGLMSTELPGAALLKARASANTANTVAAAKEIATSPEQILQTLGKANTVEQDTDADIGIAGANQFLNQNEAYRRLLQTKAGFQDKKFDINKMQPFQARAAASSALIGAGTKNVNNGIQDILGSIGNLGNEFDASGGFGGGEDQSMVPPQAVQTYAAPVGTVNNQYTPNTSAAATPVEEGFAGGVGRPFRRIPPYNSIISQDILE